MNAYEYDLKHNCAYHASYVLLSELKEIAKDEPFSLYGYLRKNKTTHNQMANSMHHIMQDGVFDITSYVIPCYDNNKNQSDDFEKIYFQSKCVTHLINKIEKELTFEFGTDIFDNKHEFSFSPENVRIIFWYDEDC